LQSEMTGGMTICTGRSRRAGIRRSIHNCIAVPYPAAQLGGEYVRAPASAAVPIHEARQ
jgi:hypothetical protein